MGTSQLNFSNEFLLLKSSIKSISYFSHLIAPSVWFSWPALTVACKPESFSF